MIFQVTVPAASAVAIVYKPAVATRIRECNVAPTPASVGLISAVAFITAFQRPPAPALTLPSAGGWASTTVEPAQYNQLIQTDAFHVIGNGFRIGEATTGLGDVTLYNIINNVRQTRGLFGPIVDEEKFLVLVIVNTQSSVQGATFQVELDVPIGQSQMDPEG